MSKGAIQQSAGCGLVKPDNSCVVADKEVGAIWGEGNGTDLGRSLQGFADRPAGGRIPELRGPVSATGQNSRPSGLRAARYGSPGVRIGPLMRLPVSMSQTFATPS